MHLHTQQELLQAVAHDIREEHRQRCAECAVGWDEEDGGDERHHEYADRVVDIPLVVA